MPERRALLSPYKTPDSRFVFRRWIGSAIMSSEMPPENKANSEQCRRSSLPMETTTTTTIAVVVDGDDRPAANDGRSVGTKVIRRAFDDQALEELYQKYCQRSKESDLDCFFLTGCLVAVHTAVSLSLKQQAADAFQPLVLVCAGVSSVVAVAQASLGFYIRGRKKTAGDQATLDVGQPPAATTTAAAAVTSIGRLTYTAWLLANVLILGLLAVVPTFDHGTRALTWLLLVNFLTCVTLPIRLRVCLLLTSAASLLFLVVSAFTSWDEAGRHRPTLHQQVVFPSTKKKETKRVCRAAAASTFSLL